jgi:hypothetical protein
MSDTKIHMAFGYAIALKEYINDQPAWALDYNLAYCPDIYTRTHKLSNPVEFYQTTNRSQHNKNPNYDPDRQGEICLIGRTGATVVMLFKLLPDKLFGACVADISTSCLKGPTDDKGYTTAEVVVTVRSWPRPGTRDVFIDPCDDTVFTNRGLLVHSPTALTKFINNNRGWTLCRRHEHVLNQMETERAVMRGLIERSLGAKFGVSNRLKLIDDVPDALM